MDPDYIQSPNKEKVIELEKKGEDELCQRVVRVINKTIVPAVQDKKDEVEEIGNRILNVQQSLGTLRYCASLKYYGFEKFTKSSKKNDKDTLPEVHPTVRNHLGKTPLVFGDESKPNVTCGSPSTCEIPVNTRDGAELPVEECLSTKNKSASAETDSKQTKVYRNPTSENITVIAQGRQNRLLSKKRIVIGNTYQYLHAEEGDSIGNNLKYKWRVYVRTAPEEEPLDTFVSYITFTLDRSYEPHDVVVLNQPPFVLSRRGWGEFKVGIDLTFKEPRNKPIRLLHALTLGRPDDPLSFTGLWRLGKEVWYDIKLYEEFKLSDPCPELTTTTSAGGDNNDQVPSTVLKENEEIAHEVDGHVTIEHNKLSEEMVTQFKEENEDSIDDNVKEKEDLAFKYNEKMLKIPTKTINKVAQAEKISYNKVQTSQPLIKAKNGEPKMCKIHVRQSDGKLVPYYIPASMYSVALKLAEKGSNQDSEANMVAAKNIINSAIPSSQMMNNNCSNVNGKLKTAQGGAGTVKPKQNSIIKPKHPQLLKPKQNTPMKHVKIMPKNPFAPQKLNNPSVGFPIHINTDTSKANLLSQNLNLSRSTQIPVNKEKNLQKLDVAQLVRLNSISTSTFRMQTPLRPPDTRLLVRPNLNKMVVAPINGIGGPNITRFQIRNVQNGTKVIKNAQGQQFLFCGSNPQNNKLSPTSFKIPLNSQHLTKISHTPQSITYAKLPTGGTLVQNLKPITSLPLEPGSQSPKSVKTFSLSIKTSSSSKPLLLSASSFVQSPTSKAKDINIKSPPSSSHTLLHPKRLEKPNAVQNIEKGVPKGGSKNNPSVQTKPLKSKEISHGSHSLIRAPVKIRTESEAKNFILQAILRKIGTICKDLKSSEEVIRAYYKWLPPDVLTCTKGTKCGRAFTTMAIATQRAYEYMVARKARTQILSLALPDQSYWTTSNIVAFGRKNSYTPITCRRPIKTDFYSDQLKRDFKVLPLNSSSLTGYEEIKTPVKKRLHSTDDPDIIVDVEYISETGIALNKKIKRENTNQYLDASTIRNKPHPCPPLKHNTQICKSIPIKDVPIKCSQETRDIKIENNESRVSNAEDNLNEVKLNESMVGLPKENLEEKTDDSSEGCDFVAHTVSKLRFSIGPEKTEDGMMELAKVAVWKATLSFMEDLLRASHASAFDETLSRSSIKKRSTVKPSTSPKSSTNTDITLPPSSIESHHIKNALLSRKSFDILNNHNLGKPLVHIKSEKS